MKPVATKQNPFPFVIVTSPGDDDEWFWNDYKTFKEARAALKDAKENTGKKCDIMLRLDDGRLTTEY